MPFGKRDRGSLVLSDVHGRSDADERIIREGDAGVHCEIEQVHSGACLAEIASDALGDAARLTLAGGKQDGGFHTREYRKRHTGQKCRESGEGFMTRAALLAAPCLVVVAQGVTFQPATYRIGGVPVLPTITVGGGEVLLDTAVDARGEVTSVTPLRVTPPFADLFAEAVRGWNFHPARDLDLPAPSHVMVAVLVRPPALNAASTLGEPARDVAMPRPDLPVPITLVPPLHPPNALRSGVVLIEARIDTAGRVTRVRVMQSAPPFDNAAQDAAWKWTFRAARLRGTPIESVAYLAFGFPEIVTGL